MYQLRGRDDVLACSATSRPIWDLNEMSLRRRMPGGLAQLNDLNLYFALTIKILTNICSNLLFF